MSKQWAYIIIMTVVTVIIWSGWEIYKAFETEKDVGQYSSYARSISRDFDTDMIKKVAQMQSEVLVKESDITPQQSN